MAEPVLRVERSEGVTTLTLNRPDARNALSSELRVALTDTFTALRRDDDTAVVILTGAGPAFCAGLDLREPLDRGYAFYTQRLFDEGHVSRMTDARRYPIDIHSCAEAILCLSQLADRYDDALTRAQAVAEWTLSHMRHPAGYFYYRRYRWLTIKIPYMRWGQAWMMAALARLRRALAAVGKVDLETERT